MNFIENSFLFLPIYLKIFIKFHFNKLKQLIELDHKKNFFNFLKILTSNQIYFVKFIFIWIALIKIH